MATAVKRNLEDRVIKAAEAALADQDFVSPIDVLVGLRWLSTPEVDHWRQERIDYLESQLTATLNPAKISTALATLRQWAGNQGLRPREVTYPSRSKDNRPLQFSESGDPDVEAAYRTHWISPNLSEATKESVSEQQSPAPVPRAPELLVISPLKTWNRGECGGTGELLFMEGVGPLCLSCADLDQSVFLPAGDAALTRRAKKASGLTAVVVRFSRSGRRYERQGILVEEDALAQAEASCLADQEPRERRRLHQVEHRSVEDDSFKDSLARQSCVSSWAVPTTTST
jgi:hypothetical protein